MPRPDCRADVRADATFGDGAPGVLYCDLTQSWSAKGGGVGTYIRHKRRHILDEGGGRHLLIIPGERDQTLVEEDRRAITVTIASPKVPGNPNYRLLLRNRAVRAALALHRPDLVECQDAYNLPWAAIAHRRAFPGTALVAAYCTDFPTAYVGWAVDKVLGQRAARGAARIAYNYAARLYRHFDGLFAMSENGGAATLRALGAGRVDIVPLGVELSEFSPDKRSPALRATLGIGENDPVIVYAGRMDSEKRAEIVVEAFEVLPPELNAFLVMIGDGKMRPELEARLAGKRAHFTGFVRDRGDLARWLASADVYASAMANETFGISVIEAQASGLPVVGVAAGAMIDRVTSDIGRIGPPDDAATMARNIVEVWTGDHAAMSASSWHHAQQYCWSNSMEALFGDLYPRALGLAARRGAAASAAGGATLAVRA